MTAPSAQALEATQRPIDCAPIDDRFAVAAWREKPSCYLVETRERIVPPELQRAMAARINARLHTVRSSHAVQMSHPKKSTAVILQAVAAAKAQPG